MRPLRSLWRDERGSVVIETAVAAPVLALVALGAFQVSDAYARQHELQTGADDAAAMALAGWDSDTGDMVAIKTVLKRTLGLDDDEVTIVKKFRCDATATLIDDKTTCDPTAIVTTYLRINLTESKETLWSNFGVGGPISYNIERTVLVP